MNTFTEAEWPTDVGTTKVTLEKGEWMRHPASTKKEILGPCEFLFIRNAVDGGITVMF